MKNIGNLLIFDENVQFEGSASFFQLIEQLIDKFVPSDTTPTVRNITRFRANNTGAVTVTNFDDGQDGQEIKILGDGFTTVDHGTTIFTNTGADKLLAANKVYTFTKFGTNWYENA